MPAIQPNQNEKLLTKVQKNSVSNFFLTKFLSVKIAFLQIKTVDF
ncbi:hypothetical protein llh_8965 [Lactococcus cremoris subsp. cremoris A76]|nr:hypothetical protein llh_8965 [Lactococcus cremoris subsp. cremoris A76]